MRVATRLMKRGYSPLQVLTLGLDLFEILVGVPFPISSSDIMGLSHFNEHVSISNHVD